MKKSIYSLSIAILGIFCISSCEKEEISLNKSSEVPKNSLIDTSDSEGEFDKSGNNAKKSDGFLIAAINGNKKEYSEEFDLLELLLDNSSLKDNVLLNVINSAKLSNSAVELLVIVSSPVSQTVLNHLSLQRPNLPTNKIYEAQNLGQGLKFAISNEYPKTVFFGENLIYDGQNLHGSRMSEIVLNIHDDDRPSNRPPCSSSNPKWTCGTVVRTRMLSSDGSFATYQITCEQSTNYCFRNPSNAARD